jgi:hypothetical protein
MYVCMSSDTWYVSAIGEHQLILPVGTHFPLLLVPVSKFNFGKQNFMPTQN